MSTISAGTTSTTAFKVTSDTTGSLLLKTGASGVTAVDIDASQVVTIGNIAVTGGTINNTIIGGTTAVAGSFTTLTAASTVTLNGGTANGVAYLNGSKNLTTGSALVFDGTNLGIGTSSPGYKLDVNTVGGSAATVRLNGNDQANVRLRLENGGSGGRTWEIVGGLPGANNANFSIRDVTGSTTPLTIDSSGNVGIGTTSPADKLEVRFSTNGYITASNSTDTNTGIKLSNTGRSYGIFTDGGSGSSDSLRFYDFTAAAERARITSAGNFGINSTSPYSKLQVNGAVTMGSSDSDGRPALTPTYWGYSNSYRTLLIGSASTSYATNNTGAVTVAFNYDPSVNANGAFNGDGREIIFRRGTQFVTPNAANTAFNLTNLVLIDGDVGIGTASPGSILHIQKGNGSIRLDNGDGNYSIWQQTGSDTRFGTQSAIPLVFYTNTNERARITSAGNFGIGTSSPVTKLHVAGAGNVTGGNIHMGDNTDGAAKWSVLTGSHYNGATNPTGINIISCYGSASANDVYIGGGIYESNPATSILFYTHTATTHNLGGTERARITSAGYFLVGTTTESASSGAGIKIRPGQSAGIAEVSSFSTNANDSLDLYSTGSGSYRFYVGWGGTVFATSTTISAISDQRLKENIRDLDAGLDAVMALKPRKFDWKEGKGQDKKDVRGFIAQEFEQVFPDLIDTWKDPAPEGEDPYKSVRQDLIPVLVKAIQEQQAIIEQLNSRLAALETK